MGKKLTVFIICILAVTSSFWFAGCELVGGEDTGEFDRSNYGNQGSDTSMPAGTVRGFLHVLPSGDLLKWEQYLVPEESASGTPMGFKGFVEEFMVPLTADTSLEISNIKLEELWSVGSEAAVRATYVSHKKVKEQETVLPGDYTFLLGKYGEEWLIRDFSEVMLPRPEAVIPATAPGPVVSGSDGLTGAAAMERGKVMLADDFGTRSDVWPVYSNGHGIAYYKDESLHVTHRGVLHKPEFCIARQSFDDFVLRLDTAVVEGGEDSWIIVACRTDHWANGYHFMIDDDGRYAIAVQGKKSEREFLQEPLFCEHINAAQGVLNQLCIEFVGDIIRFSVNGHLLNEIRDSTFDSGFLALGITNVPRSGRAEAMFDNLLLVTHPGTEVQEGGGQWLESYHNIPVPEANESKNANSGSRPVTVPTAPPPPMR